MDFFIRVPAPKRGGHSYEINNYLSNRWIGCGDCRFFQNRRLGLSYGGFCDRQILDALPSRRKSWQRQLTSRPRTVHWHLKMLADPTLSSFGLIKPAIATNRSGEFVHLNHKPQYGDLVSGDRAVAVYHSSYSALPISGDQ
jgi:hypothetical protein